jgi:hypothetical protein
MPSLQFPVPLASAVPVRSAAKKNAAYFWAAWLVEEPSVFPNSRRY